MSKRKQPSTSLEAYKQAKPMISPHHEKIKSALSVLGKANYEKIAAFLTMEGNQISRRLKEMEILQIVYKPGSTTPTKSGRKSYDYCLTGLGMPIIEKEVVYKKDEKSAHDFANDLINTINKPLPVQRNLFE